MIEAAVMALAKSGFIKLRSLYHVGHGPVCPAIEEESISVQHHHFGANLILH
jgi:hypothetical protein